MLAEVSARKKYLLDYQHWILWTKDKNGNKDSNSYEWFFLHILYDALMFEVCQLMYTFPSIFIHSSVAYNSVKPKGTA